MFEPDNGSFTHDDYIRLITYVVPDRHIQPTRTYAGDPEKFAMALDVRGRAFITLHKALWGTTPTLCRECADESNSMRALNCDENGNPNDA